MAAPCGHGTPVDGCPACALFGGDPLFRALWGGGPAPVTPAPARSLPCVYLGEVTDRLGCPCPGRWKRKCALKCAEVSINDDCRACPDYDAA